MEEWELISQDSALHGVGGQLVSPLDTQIRILDASNGEILRSMEIDPKAMITPWPDSRHVFYGDSAINWAVLT